MIHATLAVLALALPSDAGSPQWIWHAEETPPPAGAVRYFRKTFDVGRADRGTIEIAADDAFELFLNGDPVGAGDDWKRVRLFDVTSRLRSGKNVIAVRATNAAGDAALLAQALVDVRGGTRVAVLTGPTWKSSAAAPDGWTSLAFDDAEWTEARSLGEVGAAPWGDVAWESGFTGRFAVPEGFRVECVATPDETGSIVALATGLEPGTFLASRENGPIVAVDPRGEPRVRVYSEDVTNAQGLLALEGSVYAIGDGKDGTGLYRLRGGTTETLAKFHGGMGEHGPHAIVPGPDGRLYLAIGNHAGLEGAIDPASPASIFVEGDLLLPRYEDANGHAAGIKAPGGVVLATDPDATKFTRIAGGFRNHYDIAFDADGELFTFDSDMEWDVGAPWYRPVRIVHVVPGGEYGWRSGFAKWPSWYCDSLPPVVEPGRGSPTGVAFHGKPGFPLSHRDAFYAADWSRGRILAIHLEKEGASYRGREEVFASGSPLNVTDLAVSDDGALVFSCGGRRTQGGIYRIVYAGPSPAAEASRPVTPVASAETATELLGHGDPFVRRRALEAIVRFGAEPDLDLVFPLLSDDDRHVRFAARIALEHADVATWRERALAAGGASPLAGTHALLALVRADAGSAAAVLERAGAILAAGPDPSTRLDLLRVVELASLAHGSVPEELRAPFLALFPGADRRETRELSRILSFAKETKAGEKIVARLRAESDDVEKIDLALCARYLPPESFAEADRETLLDFYETARKFEGGHSFSRDIENVARDFIAALLPDGAAAILAAGERRPAMARLLVDGFDGKEARAREAELVRLDERVSGRADAEAKDLADEILHALGRAASDAADAHLAKVFDEIPDRRASAARAMAESPRPLHRERFYRALEFADGDLARRLLEALAKISSDAPPLSASAARAAIVAGLRAAGDGPEIAAKLLGRSFGPLAPWQAWFAERFPDEPPAALPPALSGTAFTRDQLAEFLTVRAEGRSGDAAAGAAAFEKARCAECHLFGTRGGGIGPDLTTVRSRFTRTEILESILFPSQVVSDQYRSAVVTMRDGRIFTGLAAPRGATETVLQQSDGAEIVLPNAEIAERVPSSVSAMPSGLVDGLSLREIADLFAFLESNGTARSGQ